LGGPTLFSVSGPSLEAAAGSWATLNVNLLDFGLSGNVSLVISVDTYGADEAIFIDNIAFNGSNIITTPEPTSFTLVVLGIAGLAYRGRRRR